MFIDLAFILWLFLSFFLYRHDGITVNIDSTVNRLSSNIDITLIIYIPNTRLPKQILLHLSKLNLKDSWYSNLHSVLQDLSVQNHNYSYSNIDVPFINI